MMWWILGGLLCFVVFLLAWGAITLASIDYCFDVLGQDDLDGLG